MFFGFVTALVIKAKVTVDNIEIRCPLNNLSLHDAKFIVWVAYIKRQVMIAIQMSLNKVKVTVAKIENQFPLNILT